MITEKLLGSKDETSPSKTEGIGEKLPTRASAATITIPIRSPPHERNYESEWTSNLKSDLKATAAVGVPNPNSDDDGDKKIRHNEERRKRYRELKEMTAAAYVAKLEKLETDPLTSQATHVAPAPIVQSDSIPTKLESQSTSDTETTTTSSSILAPSEISPEVTAAAAAAAASLHLTQAGADLLLSSEIPLSTTETPTGFSHAQHLANRRLRDRIRYASMSKDQRDTYNYRRREQYHRQTEVSRKKRRQRERERYHSLDPEAAKLRNERRALLERERYKKLTPQELATRNAKRRERAAALRRKKKMEKEQIEAETANVTAASSSVQAATKLNVSPADVHHVGHIDVTKSKEPKVSYNNVVEGESLPSQLTGTEIHVERNPKSSSHTDSETCVEV